MLQRQHRLAIAGPRRRTKPTAGDHADSGRPRAPPGPPHSIRAYVMPPSASDRQHRAGHVEVAWRRAGRGSPGRGARAITDRDHRERQVDEEDPAPAGVARSARRRRTARSRRRSRRARTRRRSRAPGRRGTKAPWIIARLPGVSSAAADALQHPGDDQHLRGGRQPAQQRRRRRTRRCRSRRPGGGRTGRRASRRAGSGRPARAGSRW